jgi:hypothetical protein
MLIFSRFARYLIMDLSKQLDELNISGKEIISLEKAEIDVKLTSSAAKDDDEATSSEEDEDDWETSEPIAAPKQQQDSYDESNGLEIWNFPSFYTKKELVALFGFKVDVKWVDDTRAVIHFDSPQDLKRGYLQLCGHPAIKHKLYTPIEKRDRSTRPTTTDMVARRMIAGALGMQSRLKKTASEIESDSLKLKMVKEEKDRESKRRADEKDERRKASNQIFDS